MNEEEIIIIIITDEPKRAVNENCVRFYGKVTRKLLAEARDAIDLKLAGKLADD